MPTKKKRVGFIPREDVMKIIDELSIENNLSNSKIISILVEEALSVRGIFNRKTGRITHSYQQVKNSNKELINNSDYFNDNEKFAMNTKSGNLKNSQKENILKQINDEEFDLQIYKKFISFLKFQEMMNEFTN